MKNVDATEWPMMAEGLLVAALPQKKHFYH